MIPNKFGMLAAMAMMTMGVRLVERRPRTVADRLADIERVESEAIARAQNPHVIAAQAKRERRRQKLLSA